jgi:hypothetical protein
MPRTPQHTPRARLSHDEAMRLWRARDAYRVQSLLFGLVGLVVAVEVLHAWSDKGWPWALVVALGWVVVLKALRWGVRWARWGLWWCVERVTLAMTHWWHNRR